MVNKEVYFPEKSITSPELFFSPASPMQQIEAAKKTIDSILVLNELNFYANNRQDPSSVKSNDAEMPFFEENSQSLSFLSVLIDRVLQDENCNNDPENASKVLRSTIAVLDNTVFNGMDKLRTDFRVGKHRYYRMHGVGGVERKAMFPDSSMNFMLLFMTRDEVDRIDYKTKNNPDIDVIDDLRSVDPSRPYNDPYFSQVLTSQNVEEIISFLDDPNNTYFLESFPTIRFYLSDKVGGIASFGDSRESMYFGSNPRSELPLQDVWMALLQSGIPPIDIEERSSIFKDIDYNKILETIQSDTREFLDNFEDVDMLEIMDFISAVNGKVSQKIKDRLWIEKGENFDFENLLRRKKDHYRKELGRSHSVFGEPEILLTRSGISATQTAINAIGSYFEGKGIKPKPYILKGWYFESEPFIYSDIGGNVDFLDSNILFANTSSNDPVYADDYKGNLDKYIDEFVKKAQENSGSEYFLVLDKTVNPDFEVFDETSVLPSNLQIVELMSVSKHQRGNSNYFFGAIFAWGNDNFKNNLNSELDSSFANLSDLGILHFPLLTKNEISRRMNKFKILGESIKTYFDETMLSLPPEKRWRYEDYGMFGYILPSEEIIQDAVSGSIPLGADDLSTPEGKRMVTEKVAEVFKTVSERICGFYETLSFGYSGLELGDSFGMDNTRICQVEGLYEDVIFTSPRLSPGVSMSPEDAAILGSQIGNFIAGFMK